MSRWAMEKTTSPVQKISAPQNILEEEILHSGHHEHPLSQVYSRELFKCAGCKEYGSDKRFTCRQCDFQLHEFCAYAPSALKTHPLHPSHQLSFCNKPVKSGLMKSKCDVCGKSTKGYTFRCNSCSYQMHPCCAMLSNQISISVHPHTLNILPVAANLPSGDPSFACAECKRKRSGRLFRCTVCGYYLHAVCAKNMVNGLEANGIKDPKRPSVLKAAVQLVSQVVLEFIDGIVQGIGEGVGQVIVQNAIRGKHVRQAGT